MLDKLSLATCLVSSSRYGIFLDYVEKIQAGDGDLRHFTTAYDKFGIHVRDDNSVVAMEWAPGAQEVFLTGDFSRISAAILISF